MIHYAFLFDLLGDAFEPFSLGLSPEEALGGNHAGHGGIDVLLKGDERGWTATSSPRPRTTTGTFPASLTLDAPPARPSCYPYPANPCYFHKIKLSTRMWMG